MDTCCNSDELEALCQVNKSIVPQTGNLLVRLSPQRQKVFPEVRGRSRSKQLLMGMVEGSLGDSESALKLDSGVGCTTMWLSVLRSTEPQTSLRKGDFTVCALTSDEAL